MGNGTLSSLLQQTGNPNWANTQGERNTNFAPTVGNLQQAAPPPALGHPGLPQRQAPSGPIAGPGGETVFSMPGSMPPPINQNTIPGGPYQPPPPTPMMGGAQQAFTGAQQALNAPNPQLVPPNQTPAMPSNFPQQFMGAMKGSRGLLG